MAAPGNFTLIEGDDETATWLRTHDARVDDWLYELVDGLVFYAAGRMRERAPGSIKQLVDILPAHETATGAFEGIAGVEPDITEDTFNRGLGSDPADYPVFVEVGTGVFGPIGEPISSIPGHLMGPFWDIITGREIYTSVVQGQKPQRYAEQSFEDTVQVAPDHIMAALPDLGRRD